MCVFVCFHSQASVSGSALQTAHGDLQRCLPEEELHTALQHHSKELQPNTVPMVKHCCSVIWSNETKIYMQLLKNI